MEKQLRDVDSMRKDLQMKLEYANLNWECKLNLFVKDSQEKTAQNNE